MLSHSSADLSKQTENLNQLVAIRKAYLDQFNAGKLHIAEENQEAAVTLLTLIQQDTLVEDFYKFVEKYHLIEREMKKTLEAEHVFENTIEIFRISFETKEEDVAHEKKYFQMKEARKRVDNQWDILEKTFPRPKFLSLESRLEALKNQLANTKPSDQSDGFFRFYQNEALIGNQLSLLIKKYQMLNEDLKPQHEQLNDLSDTNRATVLPLLQLSAQRDGDEANQLREEATQLRNEANQLQQEANQLNREADRLHAEAEQHRKDARHVFIELVEDIINLGTLYEKIVEKTRMEIILDFLQGYSKIRDDMLDAEYENMRKAIITKAQQLLDDPSISIDELLAINDKYKDQILANLDKKAAIVNATQSIANSPLSAQSVTQQPGGASSHSNYSSRSESNSSDNFKENNLPFKSLPRVSNNPHAQHSKQLNKEERESRASSTQKNCCIIL